MSILNIQDNILLLRLRKKDPEAFGQLYDKYVASIYRFVFFKVSSQQDAEDITSDVFLKTWQYVLEGEEVVDNIRALLFRTARNAVIDFYRRRANRELVGAEEALLRIPDDRQQSLLQQINAHVELEGIDTVLRQMKDEYREALILRYIEELSITEIATILHKQKGAVRVLLHRALRVAQELLRKKNQNG